MPDDKHNTSPRDGKTISLTEDYEVFASPGLRTTGTKAANFLVVPPAWNGDVPEGFTRINAPTPHVWIIGRTKTDGPPDYAAVHEVQKGYKITPLSRWGQPPGRRDADHRSRRRRQDSAEDTSRHHAR